MKEEEKKEVTESLQTTGMSAEQLLEELKNMDIKWYDRLYGLWLRTKDFFKCDVRWFFQKLFRGYSDIEIWNLDDTLARFVEPRLKKFMDETCGFPPDYATFEDWKADLEKMLAAVNWAAHHEEYEDKIIKECGGYWAKDKNGKPLWLEKVGAKDKEAREGLELLGKRWMHLWW